MTDQIKQWICSGLSSDRNIFEYLLEQFQLYINRPLSPLPSLREELPRVKVIYLNISAFCTFKPQVCMIMYGYYEIYPNQF